MAVRTRDEGVLAKRGRTWAESRSVRHPAGNGAQQVATRVLSSISAGIVRTKESGWAGVGPEWVELGMANRPRRETAGSHKTIGKEGKKSHGLALRIRPKRLLGI
jgi:hypothetical protein